jgi:hypothetical protein
LGHPAPCITHFKSSSNALFARAFRFLQTALSKKNKIQFQKTILKVNNVDMISRKISMRLGMIHKKLPAYFCPIIQGIMVA